MDAIAAAVRQLRDRYRAGRVVLVGHSGGATIAADVLGRHPGLAAAALLVACGCDPVAWRARNKAEHPDPVWDEPTRELPPLTVVKSIPRETKVRMAVGDRDANTPVAYTQAYADALKARGIDVRVTVIAGLGHDILFSPAAFSALESVLQEISP